MLSFSLSARRACVGTCSRFGASSIASSSASSFASFSAAWIAVLAAALFFMPVRPAQAQSPAPTTRLDPVTVTGNREPTPLSRLVGDVTVIDEQRIRNSSADSLELLLSREGGIQVSRNGGPGQISGVLLRGSSAASVVVLVDGVRIGSASAGQADLSALSLASIERIEILRGPGSSLYGADAVGGVVQIITRRGQGGSEQPSVAAHAAVGGLQSSEADFSVTGTFGSTVGGSSSGTARDGAWDYALGLGREASAGVSALRPGDAFGNYNPDRDGFTRRNAQLRAGFTLAPGQRVGASLTDSRLRSQYDASEFVAPNFTQDATPDFRNRFDVRVAALDYRGVMSEQWTSTLQWSQQTDNSVAGASAPDSFKTERRQLTWQNAFSLGDGHSLVAAVERLNESVQSSSYTATQARHNTALVLGYTGAFGAHKLQADVRHDANSVYGGVNTGKLGWAMDVAPGLTLRAVAGTAFRGVSFNDLYFPGYGVPTVRPERSRSLEAGLQWRDGEQAASATVYRNRVRDLIGYQPDRTFCPADPAYDFGCAGNVSSASLKGATLTAATRWADTGLGDIGLRATLDFLDAKDTTTGQRLVRRAAHQQSLVADWTGGPWAADATLTAVGARPEGSATLAAYQTLDLQARYRLSPSWRVEAKLLNALNRDYQPARDYQSIGRQAWLGVRYQGAGL
jgi:vitamin B12 transporter